jgi:hypothetical protein
MVGLAVPTLAHAAGPPPAYLAVGNSHVRLAVSAWCWGGRCAAPIAAAKRVAVFRRGDTVRVELRFVPRTVVVYVRGVRVRPSVHAREISWPASRGGGLTVRAVSHGGWVAYVGRIRVRAAR